jgi:tetratricopeptide (TPR) repeat protein
MDQVRIKRNIPGMLAHLKKAQEIAPNDVRVLELSFNAALMQRNWDEAAGYIPKLAAPEVNADRSGGLQYRWRLAMAKEDLKQASELADTLARDYGAFAQSLISQGQTRMALKNYEAAMQSFTQARDKQPQNIDAYRGLIECSYERKRPEDARKYIDQARQVLRGRPEFEELADEWDLKYGTPDKALASREAALKKQPDSPAVYQSLGSGYLDAAKRKEDLKDEEGRKTLLTKARDTYQQAINKFPDNPNFTSSYADACLELKDFDSAQKAWLALAGREQFKDRLETAQMLAVFYLNAHKYDLAEQAMTEFVAKHSDSIEGRFALSAVYAQEKKFDQAVESLGTSDEPRVLQRKTELLIAGGKYDQAEKLLAPIVASGRASITVLNNLGYIYHKSRRPREAVDVLNQVLAQDPQNTTALLYRAAAMMDLPQSSLDDLIRDLTAVRQAMPSNLEPRRYLAECYRRKSDFEAEFRELEDLIQVAPTDKQARMLLLEAYSTTVPPRWGDAERVAGEIKQIPELAKDVDMLLATARMWSRKGKAQTSQTAFQNSLMDIQAALQQQPKNLNIVQVFYTVMLQGKAYPQLLAHTDQMPPEIQNLWWVKHDRAIAKARMKDPSATQACNDALNQCLAIKDDAAAQLVVNSMASELGVDVALQQVQKQVQTGQPQWLMLGAVLQQRRGDIAQARQLVDRVLGMMDKLSDPQQASVLNYAGTLFMIDPDPDTEKAKAIYQRLAKIRPDDFTVWNNLACMRDISPQQSLEYSQKAVDLMRKTGRPEPYVLDTHGWNLVQASRIDEGIAALNDAWAIEQFPDLAYHLGVANLRKGNLEQADRFLQQGSELFQKKLEAKSVTSMKLQDEITAAQKELREARNKAAQGS